MNPFKDWIPDMIRIFELRGLLAVKRVQTDSEKIHQQNMWGCVTPIQGCNARQRDESRHRSANESITAYTFPSATRFADENIDSAIQCLIDSRTNCHISYELFPHRAQISQNVAQTPVNKAILGMSLKGLS